MSLEAFQSDLAAALLHARDTFVETNFLRAAGIHERLALYRGNVRAAWEKGLANAYPVIRALAGEVFFRALARAYGDAHPSRSGNLNEFGAELSEFVATFEHTQVLPYLGDVAALEWTVHRARYAADADGLARERMAAMLPQDLLNARFMLHPALAWHSSSYPIATIWRAHQPNPSVALPASLGQREAALVVRPRWHVEVLESSSAEIAALAALRVGASMDDAIGAAFEQDSAFAFARALVRWLDLGVLVGIHEP